MSRQMTFTLTCAALLSVIVPGCAGYLSARLEAIDQAHRRLASMETRLREAGLPGPALAVPPFPLCGPSYRSAPKARQTAAAHAPHRARGKKGGERDRTDRRGRERDGAAEPGTPRQAPPGTDGTAGDSWAGASGTVPDTALALGTEETPEAGEAGPVYGTAVGTAADTVPDTAADTAGTVPAAADTGTEAADTGTEAADTGTEAAESGEAGSVGDTAPGTGRDRAATGRAPAAEAGTPSGGGEGRRPGAPSGPRTWLPGTAQADGLWPPIAPHAHTGQTFPFGNPPVLPLSAPRFALW
ncbi:hypothetical protein [Planomonospora alba]